MKDYLVIKRKNVLLHAAAWMALKHMLNEGSQSKKHHTQFHPWPRSVG